MVLTLRVRACTKCEKYVVIHPDNPVSQIIVNNYIIKILYNNFDFIPNTFSILNESILFNRIYKLKT